MPNFELNTSAIHMIQKLWDAGYEAYLVGGCVRDLLIGQKPKDWDITTNAFVEEIMQVFDSQEYKIIPKGIKHGTVAVAFGGSDFFEITTYRVDGKYSDGRRPDTVTFTRNLREDLARRDFTINAMAYNPLEDKLIDYFNGSEDLIRGVIKCVGDPKERISEDYLRMLRAIRFACRFNFELDHEVYKAIILNRQHITNISAERVRDELFGMMLANPRKAMQLLVNTTILKWIIPEFWGAVGYDQKHPAHRYDLCNHTIEAMANEYASGRIDLIVALLLHDLGKLTTQEIGEDRVAHYRGHPEESVEIAEGVLDRLKVSNEFKKKVITLIKYHDTRINDAHLIKRFINKIGAENLKDLYTVQLCDLMAHSTYYVDKYLPTLKHSIAEFEMVVMAKECATISKLAINGNDLKKIGMKQGKEIGDVLRKLLDIVIEHPELNDRDYLIKQVKSLIKRGEI